MPMSFTNLGRTGCKVSRLCLGTMNFGPRTSETDSHDIMNKALEEGINFWDTADVYGGEKGKGATEEIIGRWFQKNPSRRNDVVLATKYQGSMGSGPNDRGASAIHIRAACEASLRRLQTDHIDLYQMHHINRDCPWEEVYEALDVLVKQGKLIYSGSSNYAGWHIAQAVEAARRQRVLGLVSEQSKYSLACRHVELEVLPACRHYGLAVIAWSPLDGGLLAGMESVDKGSRRDNEHARKKAESRRQQMNQWLALCKELGHHPSEVALAWLLHVPGLTAPIIGPRSMDQLKSNLRALEIKLDAATLAHIDDIWPPAGLPEIQRPSKSPFRYDAPEAYAW